MGIIAFDPNMVIKFVPEYGGNREDDNPCVIGLHYTPFVKLAKYDLLYTRRAHRVIDPEGLPRLKQDIQRRRFLDNVVSVSGVYEGDREITYISEFYDVAPQELILEILAAMESSIKIKAGLLKALTPQQCRSKGTK